MPHPDASVNRKRWLLLRFEASTFHPVWFVVEENEMVLTTFNLDDNMNFGKNPKAWANPTLIEKKKWRVYHLHEIGIITSDIKYRKEKKKQIFTWIDAIMTTTIFIKEVKSQIHKMNETTEQRNERTTADRPTEPTNQRTKEGPDERSNERKKQRTNRQKNQGTNERLTDRPTERRNGRTNERTKEQTRDWASE